MPFGHQSSSWDQSLTPLWSFPRAAAGSLAEYLPSEWLSLITAFGSFWGVGGNLTLSAVLRICPSEF